MESPSATGLSPATGAPFRQSPFRPWLATHHRPSENVNLACSRDTVETSGSASSTGPRPARAPDITVSATDEPVTSRSTGIAGRASIMVTAPSGCPAAGYSCATSVNCRPDPGWTSGPYQADDAEPTLTGTPCRRR